MTRLITEWIETIEETMPAWNKQIQEWTGYDLADLAARGAGAPEGTGKGNAAAVIPITSGEGIIGQFAQSVQGILNGIGMKATVTEHTDVAGLYEAVGMGADVAFLADDDRFIALNLKNGTVGENDLGTALGYRQLLEDCCRKRTGEGLDGKRVLLLGYGRVGKIMYDLLLEKGAEVTVYDKDPSLAEELKKKEIPQIREPEEMKDYSLIVDLTNEGEWIDQEWLHEDVIMAAPGVPLSLKQEDADRMEGRIIHDDLQIGTAVMVMLALKVSIPQGGT